MTEVLSMNATSDERYTDAARTRTGADGTQGPESRSSAFTRAIEQFDCCRSAGAGQTVANQPNKISECELATSSNFRVRMSGKTLTFNPNRGGMVMDRMTKS
jgi:hypothetical protein